MRTVTLVLVTLCAATGSVSGSEPVDRHAEVVLRYSLDLQAGEHLVVQCGPASEELNEAVYRAALEIGAVVTVFNSLRHEREIELREASDEALRWVSPVWKAAAETADAWLKIGAPENTREAAGTDPARRHIVPGTNWSRHRRCAESLGEAAATPARRAGQKSSNRSWTGPGGSDRELAAGTGAGSVVGSTGRSGGTSAGAAGTSTRIRLDSRLKKPGLWNDSPSR